MGYKTIDELMCHLNGNNIKITEDQKSQLMNTGYYHGYKGYRFFNTSNRKIPFSTYEEVFATIKYDSQLKALFYEKIMYIETAVKCISLECILEENKSENIQDMYNNLVCGYHDFPPNTDLKTRKGAQERKLKLEGIIHGYLSKAYKDDNPKITHYYNNMSYNGVPLWALFEIITLGDFGYLLSCLNLSTRDAISTKLGMNVAAIDTNRALIYKYIYTLKDLRNAIAHNAVVFDTRFRKIDPSKSMKICLQQEFSLPYVNFKTIGDYLFLVCYYLKLLNTSNEEIIHFINNFETITQEYKNAVLPAVSNVVIHPDTISRVSLVKSQFIN